ncbi:hypothetical protein [Xanthobacter oligotrophicus]|uniref:hypothetical protein n=1 Tax=Xanthobacter oligotrophicus TaxID=2607286 RepID=UPI0011F3FA0D|nr:hypothetical protein [Xanthobacter oligotrophicus]MCG5237115.1 hypothetical protein [Xanthobacter oligotrophicus]
MKIETRSEKMQRESLDWLEVVLALPEGAQTFQDAITQATQSTASDLAALSRTLILADAAISVAEVGGEAIGNFAPWYREKAQGLMRRAMEIIEAMEEHPPSGSLN